MDFSTFVGLPWKDRGRGPDGYDCWGLYRAILHAGLGVDLPGYDDRYTSARDREEVRRIVRNELSAWREVLPGNEKAFDGVLIKRGGAAAHIGCVVRRGQLLHMISGRSSVIETYATDPYPARIAGFYRHEAMR